MQNLTQTMIELWQAACQGRGRPSCRVDGGHFVFSVSGNRGQWEDLCKAAGVPSHAEETTVGDTLTVRWESHADSIFGAGGLLAGQMENYEVRPQQLWMGRMVQRSIEMAVPAVVEAGTGTGKSFAYAAVCMAMGKRLVISTSNKALQMQLYKKDIPFLSTLFPGKRVALVQGKGNYACRAKVEGVLGGVNIANPALASWYKTTETGNVEEIPFAVDWKELAEITADDRCLGKMCERYGECFYYAAKEQRAEADVLICNHMLLCMDRMYPGANIVPGADVIVVDEAHKLADYARNVLGVEFRLSALEKAVQRGGKYDADSGAASDLLRDFEYGIHRLQDSSREAQIGLGAEQVLVGGAELAAALNELAESVWRADELPSRAEQALAQKEADALRTVAGMVEAVSATTATGFVRWIDQGERDNVSLHCAPYDVSEFIGRLAGFWTTENTSTQLSASGEAVALDSTRCTACGRKLTADTVAILDGQPYGPDCILKVDLFGDAERVSLGEWLAQEHGNGRTDSPTYEGPRTPVIFTSATLAAPDMAHFLRESGIAYALQMQVESPFDYKKNALLYVPNGATPDPNTESYLSYLIGDLRNLVQASRGGAFLLFTSFRVLNEAVAALRYEFEGAGWPVFVQGELPKLEIAKRFREQGNGVLFATKSFFEGVSIDGDALRLVVIDKMPFEAPNPLNTAQEAALKVWAIGQGKSQREAEFYPFNHLRVPKMIIEVKQGVGRLIRTATDRGVMAVLDPRIRSKSYGRQMVLPSMPPARLVSSTAEVGAFYAERRAVLATPIVPTLPTLPVNGKNGNGKHKVETALFVEKKLNRDEDGELWA